jgi:hypothetical protein
MWDDSAETGDDDNDRKYDIIIIITTKICMEGLRHNPSMVDRSAPLAFPAENAFGVQRRNLRKQLSSIFFLLIVIICGITKILSCI